MPVDTNPTVKTLGDWAYIAVEKHCKKILKWESAVKKDEDPEALHQMRVGMRRLRSAIAGFAPALNLPKPITDQHIGKMARCLGSLRDLDVLKDELETRYQPNLPKKEQKLLVTAVNALVQQRQERLAAVQGMLKSDRYKSFKQALKDWLEKPSYGEAASQPIHPVLPDLLLPEISRLFLHPAWLFATQIEHTEVVVPTNLSPAQLQSHLATHAHTLHSLRKEAKRARYQMELFTDFYGETYAVYLEDIAKLQTILGEMQDSVVLAEWLTEILNSEIHTKLPTLAAELANNRYKGWQEWQPLQQRYLSPKTRHNFHLTLLYPKNTQNHS